MNVHFSYKVQKTSDLEKELNHFVEKLQKRLQVFRPELLHLKGSVEQNSAREGFLVSLNLRLPSGQMAAQESASTAGAALKAACDDILQQTNKHKELLRSSHKWQRRRTQENRRGTPQVPFEATIAAVPSPMVSTDEIRSYVNANLARLQRFIQREIIFRESEERVEAGFLSEEEVIDEAIARALGDGVEKPDRLALEPWLYRLALRAMDDLASRDYDSSSSVPLEVSARKPNVRGSDEPELQFHQPDETLTGENVIADRRIATPEDIASSDEMVTLVESALGGAERVDREAFILHGIEGFSIEEIADITERTPEAIRSSITAAREHLRASPPIANRYKDKLLQETKG